MSRTLIPPWQMGRFTPSDASDGVINAKDTFTFFAEPQNDITFSFINVSNGVGFSLVLTQPATAVTVTWPAVVWPGGMVPTVGDGDTAVFSFIKVASTYYGTAALAGDILGGAAYLEVGTTAGTVAAGNDSRIVGAAQKSANLSDLGSASTARTNLGLGTSATVNTGTSIGNVLLVANVGGNPALPALDASLLLNVPGAAIEVVNASYTGAKDGQNQLYTMSGAYQPESIKVYFNGLRQDLNSGHFAETNPAAGTVTTSFIPEDGDDLTFDYVPAS